MAFRWLASTNLIAFALVIRCLPASAQSDLTPAEARGIAREAYVYGFPLVDHYRISYAYYVDRTNPEFKALFNEIRNIPRVYTPEDRAIQTPNSDTPYSLAMLDLRSEPVVLTLPAIEPNRYYSVMLVDAYTHNTFKKAAGVCLEGRGYTVK
jgi:hypothetical protein